MNIFNEIKEARSIDSLKIVMGRFRKGPLRSMIRSLGTDYENAKWNALLIHQVFEAALNRRQDMRAVEASKSNN